MEPKIYKLIKWVFFPVWLVWCLPQNLVGLCVWIYSKIRGYCKRTSLDDIVYYEVDNSNPAYGVSLGLWIFLRQAYFGDRITVHHEYGHEIQSLILGPFYLIVIGIPSGISNVPWLSKLIYGRYPHTAYQYYHEFPWERTADYAGGIKHEIPREGELIRLLEDQV